MVYITIYSFLQQQKFIDLNFQKTQKFIFLKTIKVGTSYLDSEMTMKCKNR